MTKKTVKRDKVQEVFEELQKIEDYIKDKAREMMETGMLTPNMLPIKTFGGENPVEVSLEIIYKDGTTSTITKNIIIELELAIHDGDAF